MFARTCRLMLRPAWPEEIAALPPAARTLVDRAAGPTHLPPALLVFQRTAGAPRCVGMMALHRTDDGDTDLACWIRKADRRRGFATEAAAALIETATHALRLPRLIARHDRQDVAAAGLLHGLGFRITGRDGAGRTIRTRDLARPGDLLLPLAA